MNTAISVAQETHLLNSLFGIEKPQISNVLYKKQGYDLTLVQMLASLGMIEETAGVEVSHFEEDFLRSPVITLNAVSAGAAGAAVTITLSPSAIYSGTNDFYVQLNDRLRFANGTVGEVVDIDLTVPSAPVITVEPASATGVIPALTANSQIGIIDNRQNEVNTERKSAYRAPVKYTYPLQIISTTTSITGTAEAVKKWYDKYDGGEDAKAFMRNIINATYDHYMSISYAMWFEQPTTNTSLVPTGERGSMQGIIDWTATAGATVVPYTPGTFTTSTFKNIEQNLDKYFCNRTYLFTQGLGLARDVNDAMNNTLASNSMAYFRPTDSSSFTSILAGSMAQSGGAGVEFNINSYKSNSRTFHFTSVPQFSDPSALNVLNSGVAVGTDYIGVGIPIDKEKVSGSSKPTTLLKMRFLPRNNSKGYIRLSQTGANAPNQTTNTDDRKYHLLSDVGNELFIPERWFLIKPY